MLIWRGAVAGLALALPLGVTLEFALALLLGVTLEFALALLLGVTLTLSPVLGRAARAAAMLAVVDEDTVAPGGRSVWPLTWTELANGLATDTSLSLVLPVLTMVTNKFAFAPCG
jgi:hypothetical protein